MVISYKAGPELGIIEVHTTNEGGHPIDFWADLCVKKNVYQKKTSYAKTPL